MRREGGAPDKDLAPDLDHDTQGLLPPPTRRCTPTQTAQQESRTASTGGHYGTPRSADTRSAPPPAHEQQQILVTPATAREAPNQQARSAPKATRPCRPNHPRRHTRLPPHPSAATPRTAADRGCTRWTRPQQHRARTNRTTLRPHATTGRRRCPRGRHAPPHPPRPPRPHTCPRRCHTAGGQPAARHGGAPPWGVVGRSAARRGRSGTGTARSRRARWGCHQTRAPTSNSTLLLSAAAPAPAPCAGGSAAHTTGAHAAATRQRDGRHPRGSRRTLGAPRRVAATTTPAPEEARFSTTREGKRQHKLWGGGGGGTSPDAARGQPHAGSFSLYLILSVL